MEFATTTRRSEILGQERVWCVANKFSAQRREIVPGQYSLCTMTQRKEMRMKLSEYKSYDDLPLSLNAATVAKVLGIAPSSAYELMHQADFPTLKIGNRIVVPKEKFVEWVERHTQGSSSP